MRSSKYLDYWGKIKGKEYRSGLSSISVIKERSGVVFDYKLHGGTVLCGANGSGKSSLLKFLSRNSETHTSLNPSVNRVVWDAIGDGGKSGIYLSPTEEINCLLQWGVDSIPDGDDFIDFIDGVGGAVFSAAALEQINYVLSSAIEKITVYEVPIALGYELEDGEDSNDDNTFSYFSVERNGETVYSESLSLGELYVIFLYWFLSINIKGPASVFLDEPESFLSPGAQYRLADTLAYLSVDKCIQFLFATHSHCFVEKYGLDSTLVAAIDDNEFLLTKPDHKSQCLYSLGYVVSEESIVLLEDKGAARFFNCIFKALNLHWVRNRKLVPLKGESDITEILKRITSAVDVIGVYDGDQRGKVGEKIGEHNVYLLPGNAAPEVILIDHIKQNPAGFAERINIGERDVKAAFRKLKAVDHHDFFGELSAQLKYDSSNEHGGNKLFEDAFRMWLSVEENKNSSIEFISRLDSSFES